MTAPRWTGRLVRGAFFLYPAVAGSLWIWTPLGPADALFLAVLLELLPALAVAQVPLVGAGELDRRSAYLGSALTVLLLGAVGLLLGWRAVGLTALGLGRPEAAAVVVWTTAITGAGLAVVGLFHLLARLRGLDESPLLRSLLPRSRDERIAFAGLSLAAGVGEELAFRGYAIMALFRITGSLWTAAVVSSIVFGLLHAYQGAVGVARTAAMGMVLAAGYLLSGSLWPAVLAHVALDLLGGLVLGDRLIGEGGGTAEADREPTGPDTDGDDDVTRDGAEDTVRHPSPVRAESLAVPGAGAEAVAGRDRPPPDARPVRDDRDDPGPPRPAEGAPDG